MFNSYCKVPSQNFLLNSLFLVKKYNVKNSVNLFQLIFLVICSVVVWFDSDISFLRHVQNICKSCFTQIRDLKCVRSYRTCHADILLLQMLWLEVNLTTVIPCSEVSQLLIFLSCNVFWLIWLELLPTPLSTHTSLLLGRLFIGCLLNTIAYSRLPYWCTSSYIVVIQIFCMFP